MINSHSGLGEAKAEAAAHSLNVLPPGVPAFSHSVIKWIQVTTGKIFFTLTFNSVADPKKSVLRKPVIPK